MSSAAGLLFAEAEVGVAWMCLEAVEQFVAFLGYEAFAQLKLRLALLEVLSGDALEVVDVVNVHVLELVAVGIDVARHGNIDEQQRPMAPLPEQPLKLVACEHVVRRGGAANDNVNLLELLLPRVEADGAAVEFGSQCDGPCERFETRTLCAPRLLRARAAFSLVSPAPMTSTCRDLSESKMDSANSTATELTEMLPR